MKPYLVDVPVRVHIWIRSECQKKQFEVIKKARPSTLFLVSDGGRNEKEWEAIIQNRKMIDESIDWDCTVYRLYEDVNNGMYAMSAKTRELIWDKVDRCILLEDDIIPSVSYFAYCADLLEKYKDDERIYYINGMNHCGVSENVNADYFFSQVGSIWGCALWKRSYNMIGDYEYIKDSYIMDLFKKNTRKNKAFFRSVYGYMKGELVDGHKPGTEFYLALPIYLQNQLQIVPKKNMICCMGNTSNSAHSAEAKFIPKGLQKVFNMKTYEIKFPLKHANYVVPDYKYKKKVDRIMGRPIHIKIYRKIESIFRLLVFGNSQLILKKIKRWFNQKKIIEK